VAPFLIVSVSSFVEMIKYSATFFPSSVYDPPAVPANNLPALNINLGGVNVSLGGNSTGVYRTSGDMGVGVQTDGIKDGMKTLFGKVKQGVDQIRNS
jgi:vacuolar protein sorting-associated protein 45